MRRLLPLVVLAWAIWPDPLRAQLPEAPPPHRYEIEARLDPEAHRVDGRERIRWTNTSREPVSELYFHLYLNAFAHDETVFMRESGGQLRGKRFRGRGSLEVLELRVPGGPDLLPRADAELIDGDRTQMRVDLPEPVPPGDGIELICRFRANLPPLFARSGYVRDFHVVAQWFPKLARLRPDGRWVSFPYHGVGEFHADFAEYDLTVVTPPEFVVAATGRRTADRTEDGHRIRRFEARWVHDTAFVAWPHFLERRERVEGTEVRWVYPPGYEPALAQHAEVTRSGLRRFGRLYGAYPYESLTVVVPPRGAEGGAGMEYPTLFLTWGPWFAVPGVRVGLHGDVTAHELAHQWFQGMVATNEVRWPMLDEGLANWASWDLLGAMYGRRRSALGAPWPAVDGFELLRQLAFFGRGTPPPARAAPDFRPASYARAIYGRVPVVFETVARTWGRERFHEALGRFARRHRFGHPTPSDLYAAFDAVYGAGFADRILRPSLEQNHHAGVALAEAGAEPIARGFRTRVRAVRTGRVPVPAHVGWVGARQVGGKLPAGENEAVLLHRGPEPLAAAVDPHHRVLLDPDVTDDARRPAPFEPPVYGLLSRGLLWAQTLLGLLGP
ncbi:MAG: M1 family metallopeptidase [Myxococcota bacterium]